MAVAEHMLAEQRVAYRPHKTDAGAAGAAAVVVGVGGGAGDVGVEVHMDIVRPVAAPSCQADLILDKLEAWAYM